ncbi:MAG TPA: kelch repeat-containing protein, partial [Thermoplasmata archaeon]|nr:kelch repeat-containing protein [Thermoplasmata archaeon]
MQRTPFGGSPPPGGLPRFDLVAAVILAVVVVGLLPSYGGQSPAHTAAPGAGPGASLTANALAMAHPHGVRGSLKWTQLAPGASPSGRSAFMMAYDPVDHEVVLFGGTPRFLGDTWTFANGNWTQLTPATSPPARYGGTMSFDAKDGYVLLFGGLGARGALNDTW